MYFFMAWLANQLNTHPYRTWLVGIAFVVTLAVLIIQ